MGFNLLNQRDVGIVRIQLIEAKNTPSQPIITQKRRNAFTHGLDQAVVNCNGDIIFKEGGLERAREISRPRAKHISFD